MSDRTLGLNDADHAYWCDYVRHLADLLGLKDWRVDVFRERSDDGTDAQVHLMADARRARIALGVGWEARPPEQQRLSVVHELIHCHLWRAEQAAQRYGDIVGGDAVTLMVRQVQHEGELATDALGEAIAGYFPLPWGRA